ncbi:MAG: hypothetical protein ACOVNP_06355 [Flavobacterium sp.]
MKKILFVAILLLCSATYAQDTFVRKYTKLVSTKNNVEEPEKEINITVVFNPKGEKEIKFYYTDTGKTKTFYQVSGLETGKTEGGYEYQLIEVIDGEDGYKLILQLFDNDDVLRLIISEGYIIEFSN